MPIHRLRLAGALLGALALTGLVACAPGVLRTDGGTAVDPADEAAFSAMLDDLADERVVYVGEIHDRYDHHLNQLAVVRGLHERGVPVAIGVEWFQNPYQPVLDEWSAGRISDREMLRRTEYFERWRFDYRLYRDVLDYARAEGIPVIALNAPAELVSAVSAKGIEGLPADQRALLPAVIPPADPAYERRLRAAFEHHADLPEERFKRFMEVQSVWDEVMAGEAAEYLAANPDRNLVVLAGAAHVLHGAAIPGRVARRLPADQAVVVTEPFEPFPGVEPDYVLAARDIPLARPGSSGMSLRSGEDGVWVHGVRPGSPADRAGLRAGDRVLRIGSEATATLADARLGLMGAEPGSRLRVVVRPGGSGAAVGKTLTLL
jgi:uncharacterized iron-regulated protein